ncbi:unnamed protein product, partial [Mesorhabditis belari]|uniref:F-box domain-containing protein n=1 Tax=Mesorhabditis belari TaxID=2138241 RepID=A0AAF3EFS8_9BILA
MNVLSNGNEHETGVKTLENSLSNCNHLFPISQLSYSLQKLILSKLKIDERKDLAFTNRTFRKLIASFGPLQERILEIRFKEKKILLPNRDELIEIPIDFALRFFSNYLRIKRISLDLIVQEPNLEILPKDIYELELNFRCTVPLVRFLTKFLITRQKIPITLHLSFERTKETTCDCHPRCSNNPQTLQKIFRTKLPLRFRTIAFQSKPANEIPFSLSFGHPDIRFFDPDSEYIEALLERLSSGIVDNESRIIGFHFANHKQFAGIVQQLKRIPAIVLQENPLIRVHQIESEVWTTENGKCKRQRVTCQIFVHSRMLYFLQNYENSPEDCLVFLCGDDIFRRGFCENFVEELLPRKLAKVSIKD